MVRFDGVKAVYFDLDDTLCAYWDASKVGLRKAFELHAPAGHSPEQMVEHWARAFRAFCPSVKGSEWYDSYLKGGEPTRTEQMRLTLLEIGVHDLELAHTLSHTYMVERDKALKLFPETLEVLNALRGRYPMGLITNGPADVQRQEVATLGLSEYFDPILIEGEMGEGKPLMSVFRRAERLIGAKPEQILFVGNSYLHDIKPAIEAGWSAVWVRRDSDVPPSAKDSRPHKEMGSSDPQPDAMIGDLRELLPMLPL